MSVYLVVDKDNVIQNNIEWDGVSDYSPGEGLRLVAYDGPAGAGWKWDGAKATDPNPPSPQVVAQPTPLSTLERLAKELGLPPEALTAKLVG